MGLIYGRSHLIIARAKSPKSVLAPIRAKHLGLYRLAVLSTAVRTSATLLQEQVSSASRSDSLRSRRGSENPRSRFMGGTHQGVEFQGMSRDRQAT
jgi:hypothetical protein